MEQEIRITELAARAAERSIRVYTHFLDLNQQKEAVKAARAVGIMCDFFGGMRDPDNEDCTSERKICCFFDMDPPDEYDYPLTCIRIIHTDKRFSNPLSHRDILGSLMSLGVQREYIGDIVPRNDHAYVFCLDKQSMFFCDSLSAVGGRNVKCEISEIPKGPVRNIKEVVIQVASMRLDNVIAHLFGLSRDSAQELIKTGKAAVDDAVTVKPEKELHDGNVLSVRGYGRARVMNLQSISKKGKLNLLIGIYS